MNKVELSKQISNKFNNLGLTVSNTVSKTIIEMVIAKIIDELNTYGESKVDGLGTFKVKEVKKRKFVIKSPIAKKRIGEEIEIGGFKKITFKDYESTRKKLK